MVKFLRFQHTVRCGYYAFIQNADGDWVCMFGGDNYDELLAEMEEKYNPRHMDFIILGW